MAATYFTSDLHLGHEQIIHHANRPFASVEEMNETILERINGAVGPSDTLYLLGDVTFRVPREEAAELLGRIRCRNTYLVKGNHDRNWEGSGLFKDVWTYKELRLEGLPSHTVLFHYPIAEWNRCYQGAVHLHGHIHSKGWSYNLENFESHHFAYDVGVDAHDFFPVALEEIVELYRSVNRA